MMNPLPPALRLRGLLKQSELREWIASQLSRLSLGSAADEITRIGNSLHQRRVVPAGPLPFQPVPVIDGSVVKSAVVTPGVIAGLQGFVVPSVGGVSIFRNPPPVITDPGDYFVFKIVMRPSVYTSSVTSTDLIPGPLDPPDAETRECRWVAAASFISAEILTTDDPYDTGAFPLPDYTAWDSSDPGVINDTTLYLIFAQWNPDTGSYGLQYEHAIPILLGHPSADLQNAARGTSDTSGDTTAAWSA